MFTLWLQILTFRNKWLVYVQKNGKNLKKRQNYFEGIYFYRGEQWSLYYSCNYQRDKKTCIASKHKIKNWFMVSVWWVEKQSQGFREPDPLLSPKVCVLQQTPTVSLEGWVAREEETSWVEVSCWHPHLSEPLFYWTPVEAVCQALCCIGSAGEMRMCLWS